AVGVEVAPDLGRGRGPAPGRDVVRTHLVDLAGRPDRDVAEAATARARHVLEPELPDRSQAGDPRAGRLYPAVHVVAQPHRALRRRDRRLIDERPAAGGRLLLVASEQTRRTD